MTRPLHAAPPALLAAVLATAGACDAPSDGGGGGPHTDDGGAASGGGSGAAGTEEDGVATAPCRPPETAGPLHCSALWDCLLTNPPECRDDHCPAADGAEAVANAFGDCVGQRCAGLDPEEEQGCAADDCRVEMVECIADGDDDTCWGYEACLQRDCLPIEDDPAAGEGAFEACVARCDDEVATDRCRECRSAAYDGFSAAHCGAPLTVWERCGRANDCEDGRCAQERCPDETAALEACIERALADSVADLDARLRPCYSAAP